jgi:hypothetical protein
MRVSEIAPGGGGTHLVVLDGQIRTFLTLPVRDLHKESAYERSSDIHVVPGLIVVLLSYKINVETLHHP